MEDSNKLENTEEQSGFSPTIVGFLCNWCSYAGADLAGVSRFQYPPNVRVIRVMCSGRADERSGNRSCPSMRRGRRRRAHGCPQSNPAWRN